jgi:dTDP-4-dehydrorhamnose reductase
MKILILGASGKIGESITKFIMTETVHNLILLSSNSDKLIESERVKKYKVNSLDKKETKRICLEERPDVIINTASLSSIEQCENDKKLAFELNAHVVESLVRMAKIIDAHFIMFSSDQIFDGEKGPYTEHDKPNPINYYGKSKHAAENLCLSGCNKYSIIRTGTIYGMSSFGKCDFVDEIIYAINKKNEIEVPRGRYSTPTFTDDIARAVEKIIRKKRFGIYNVAGQDWVNKYEVALKAATIFSNYDYKILGVANDNSNTKIKYPEKAGLITLKAETDLGFKFCSLESGLQALRHQLILSNKFHFII